MFEPAGRATLGRFSPLAEKDALEPGSIYIPPDLPGAEFPTGEARPEAVLYFKLFAAAMALMHVGLVLVGMVFLIKPLLSPSSPSSGGSDDDLVIGFVYLVWGGVLAVPYLVALFGGRRRWVHTLGTVMIVITMMSVCCLPVAIPLLIQWQKPETKRWYET